METLPCEIKQVSAKGIEFIAKEEGLRLAPYLDAVKIPTIGIGSTFYEDGTRVKMTDPAITKARAIELFRNVLQIYEKAVFSFTRDDINQQKFDSLVSICYNIGVTAFKGSTLLKRVNANPLDPKITDAFCMWRNAGSKRGILLPRRQREARLYFS